MYREASGEDAKKKKPVDSEKDALKSRKQMEDSRQVRSDTIGKGLLMLPRGSILTTRPKLETFVPVER